MTTNMTMGISAKSGEMTGTMLGLRIKVCRLSNSERGFPWIRWIAENSATGLTEDNVLDYFAKSSWYDNQCLTERFKMTGYTDKVCSLWHLDFVIAPHTLIYSARYRRC